MQLWLYYAAFFNFTIPWQASCPEHDTPFDMAWALWTGKPSSFIAIGARDSYKTLTLAGSETMDIVHNACGVVHIGAIESQALKCYSYVKRNLRGFEYLFDKPPLMSRTDLINGGHLEILPCTINRVNSPHEPKVRFDEVELADRVAYNEAKFIAASDEHGNEASIVYTTTRKYAYGLAQEQIDAAIKAKQKVMLWCYKDVTERCPDERSGTEPVEVWVDLKTLQWTRKKSSKEQTPFKVFNKCLDCKIVATCRGDLKKANGIKKIQDVILKYENASTDYWLSQMECLRPSRKGLMIHGYNPDVNSKKLDWSIFLRDDGSFNSERFLYVWGKDWGWNPDATVLCMIDTHTDVVYVIKEFSLKMKTTEMVCQELMEWCRKTPFGLPTDIQCDRSEPGLIATMQSHGFHMAVAVDETDIEGGCDLLNFLSSPTSGRPMLYVDPVLCPSLVWEITVGYIRATDPKTLEPGDKPRDKDNHFVDALRYATWKYMRKYMQAAGSYNGLVLLGSQPDAPSLSESGLTGRGGIGEDEMEMLSYLLLNSDN